MIKKSIIALCFSAFLFANQETNQNQTKNLDNLLHQLEQFQKKIATQNVTGASENELKKLDKEIKLLIKKSAYLRQVKNFNKEKFKTLDNLKKIANSLYFLVKKQKNELLYFYKGNIKLNNKDIFIIGDKDIEQIVKFFLERKNALKKVKRKFLLAKIKNTINSYLDFIQSAIQYMVLSKFNKDNVIYSKGNDKYVDISYFKPFKFSLNKEDNYFVIKDYKF